MNCEDVNNNILALAEGSLDSDTGSRLRAHIDRCEQCRSQFSFMEGVISYIESEKKIKVSKGFSDNIINRIEDNKRQVFSYRSILMPLAAASVIVFGIFTGIFISELTSGNNSDVYADIPDEYYYTNEIHLETIEGFFLTNKD
jgi:anti-sigma factor RsiW